MSSSPPTSPSPSLASPTSTSSSPTPPDSPSSRAQEHSDQAPEACHFDRLSNELIVALLSYLDPTASIALYLDPPQVYNALFAVRLVSKRLCAVTRDILWRRAIIMTTSRTDIARAAGVLAALPGRALDCRELHISNMFGDPYFDVEGWAATLPSIQRITLSYTSSHLDRFAHFHHLRHLSIHNCTITLPSATAVLPYLESIRFADTHVTSGQGATTEAFPALRHVAVVYENSGAGMIEAVFNKALLAQLDFLEVACEIGLGDEATEPSYFADLPPSLAVLWHLEVNTSVRDRVEEYTLPHSIPHAQHLMLHPHDLGPIHRSLDHVVPLYRKMLRLIALHDRVPLRLVLVPANMWNCPPDEVAPADEREARQAVVDECARRGIALRTFEQPLRAYGVVPEFAAFVREEAERDEEKA
ncbi:hypothetical protein JCM8208_004409 [Rhodotorula glutinis]